MEKNPRQKRETPNVATLWVRTKTFIVANACNAYRCYPLNWWSKNWVGLQTTASVIKLVERFKVSSRLSSKLPDGRKTEKER